MVGIYKITSPSGKVYIGQSWDIRKRLSRYKLMSKSCIKQKKIFNSLKKYGVDRHKYEIIHELPSSVSQSDLDNYESVYMEAYKDCGVELLNIREAGSRGKHSSASKEVNRLSHLGKKHSQKTILLLSEQRKGAGNIMFGKRHTPATIHKMRVKRLGKVPNIEARKKQIAGTSKSILQFTKDGFFVKEWISASEAGRELGKVISVISACCRGKRPTAYGFIWKFKKH